MREKDKPGIRSLPLFRDMSDHTFDTLMQVSYAQNFPARLELFQQGQAADFLHIVVNGTVELHAEWNGRETVMGIVRPVSSFILAACIRDAPYLMSAVTLQPSRIIMLPASNLRGALSHDSGLAMAAMGQLADGYRVMVRQSKNMKLRTARERLASWILRQGQLAGSDSFQLPVEKRHLASYLGITAESLSRTIRALREDGVDVRGMRVTIADPARLRDVARPDPLLDEHEITDAMDLR